MLHYLSCLEINNFRNLTSIQIQPIDKFNIFYGENGSGKTSLLEAIYHLGIGRSFRTHLHNRVIQAGQDKFSVFGRIANDIPIGVERSRGDSFNIRLAMKPVTSISSLAEVLPIQLIDPNCHLLINSGPTVRRKFIDWGVFHVEHNNFLQQWRKFQRIIKQRNAALKQKNAEKEATLWNDDFVKTSNAIDRLRKNYINQYQLVLAKILERLLEVDKISVEYRAGWDSGLDLNEVLRDSLTKDIRQGYTFYGPHRADLKSLVGATPASEVLSRGQQKMLASAMKIAQAELLKRLTDRKCVFLIDDLPSELDGKSRRDLASVLSEVDAQVFVTGIEKNALIKLFNQEDSKMFHVEHGNITEEKINS